MNNRTAFIVFLYLTMVPLSLSAMTPATDDELSGVTGRAGVNINADVTMNISIGTLAWGDADGIGALAALPGPWVTTAHGGYVGVGEFELTNLNIKAREYDNYNGYTTAMLKPITIDVAQDPGIHNGRTFVRFGLGSLEISFEAISTTVALNRHDTFTGTLSEEMGSIHVGELWCYINPASYVDVWSHAGQGVNLTFGIALDHLSIDYVSWGDNDGLPGGNIGAGGVVWMAAGSRMRGGYAGFADIEFGAPVTLSGTVTIDVATSSAGIYAHGAPGTPTTVCHMAFSDNFTIATGVITADMKLDRIANLDSTDAGTLGNIYLDQVELAVANGSWIDIWAH
jgi:hypothetical protein